MITQKDRPKSKSFNSKNINRFQLFRFKEPWREEGPSSFQKFMATLQHGRAGLDVQMDRCFEAWVAANLGEGLLNKKLPEDERLADWVKGQLRRVNWAKSDEFRSLSEEDTEPALFLPRARSQIDYLRVAPKNSIQLLAEAEILVGRSKIADRQEVLLIAQSKRNIKNYRADQLLQQATTQIAWVKKHQPAEFYPEALPIVFLWVSNGQRSHFELKKQELQKHRTVLATVAVLFNVEFYAVFLEDLSGIPRRLRETQAQMAELKAMLEEQRKQQQRQFEEQHRQMEEQRKQQQRQFEEQHRQMEEQRKQQQRQFQARLQEQRSYFLQLISRLQAAK